jgi:3-mercaptopyruvate sulfurtransferase SseA
MVNRIGRWLTVVFACGLWALQGAAQELSGNLVSVQWLEKNLKSDELVLLDASATPLYMAKHIPGAIGADFYAYGVREWPAAAMEQRFQAWGVSPGKKVVIYDQGGDMVAARVFYDLLHHGFPVASLFLLDGGLAKWQASGGAVTKDPTPAPAKGSFRVTKTDDSVRVKLPEFLVASGDPKNHALVEALEPTHYFGEQKYFDRAGHVPNAIMLPSAEFYNADKTFKPADEIRRMIGHLGIKPEQQVHTYCGGGVAAAVPFFALKYIAGYPKVKLYQESQHEWLRDERGLPTWTYAMPNMARDMHWVDSWGAPMLRMFGAARLNVIDVRPAEAYGRGHVPFSLNLPGDMLKAHLATPDKLPSLLGPAGVNSAYETVIVSEGGLNRASALAYLVLRRAGQKKVSVLMDSLDEWGLRGLPLTKEPTVIGPMRSPKDVAVPPATFRAEPQPGIVIAAAGQTQGLYPKLFLASGKSAPAKAPDGKVVHLPYTELLDAEGKPKPAKDLWKILSKAGVTRFAEIVCIADDPGDAAIAYFVLELMGYPDLKVLAVT